MVKVDDDDDDEGAEEEDMARCFDLSVDPTVGVFKRSE